MSANLEPAIDPIEAPNAGIEIVRHAGGDRACKNWRDARHVLGMDDPVRPPLPKRFQWLTAILIDKGINGLDFAGRAQDRDQAGDAVDDELMGRQRQYVGLSHARYSVGSSDVIGSADIALAAR